MASAAFGSKSVFGADEPSGRYDDIEHATRFFVIGANMAECHPVVWERVRDRLRTAPQTRVIVVDPRRTPTARDATLHLQIRPGTDVALLNAMTYELLRTGLVDPAFINDFVTFRKGTADSPPLTLEDFQKLLEDYAPEKMANLCGLSTAEIREAARLFGISQAAMSFWTMGLNQQTHGVAANRMMMALHLLTGQIGRPGTGPFSLTGQTNAGGGVRDTGSLSHALPAGRLVSKEKDRHEMEKLWGLPEGRISPNPGLSAVPLFEAMREGKVRAALVMATNPARSLPNADRYRVGMEKAFLVVSDSIFPTDTAQYADVFLPAAMWAEKEGVLSQSERRYHLVEKLVEPPGEARSDLDILVALGERLGHGELLKARTPEAVWDEWRMISADTPYDFRGMTYARLKELPGLTWPCPTEQHPGTCHRYVPGEDPLAKKEGRIDFYARPDGRAIVYLSEQGPFRESLTSDYPMTLTTGRRLEHWHTATLTGRIPQLQGIDIDYLEIHPGDAAVMGVKEGDMVQVTSARGSVRLKALPSMRVRPGVVFALMHSMEHLVNAATSDYQDPTSAQPEYKLAAVGVERVKEGT
ncbi:molybdopterin oxidoreductase family protein [Archangium violaceum]|uniref:molybdopterin oxidoreductase family protein n=1 Tax=Archangium violaceum TaxID=83451 RepID=UPI0031B89954